MDEYKEVTLERFKLAATAFITDELLQHFAEVPKIRASMHASYLLDGLTLQVVQTVWGREAERVDVEYPADWWQAFKKRWFPEWAKRRWPVNMTKVALVARELYPDVAMPDKSHVIATSKFFI